MRRVTEGYLTGNLLVAMPTMGDPRFARSLVYLCAHSDAGALGLVVNRLSDDISFAELLRQLGLEPPADGGEIRVHFGGPVEESRGFVLHSGDYAREATLVVDEDVGLTASVDVLSAIAEGHGPRHSLLALGYAGWAPGQLEAEIQANGWLHVDADEELLFGDDVNGKWDRAMKKIGLDISVLSGEAGSA
ncbi:MAG: YqgE/AlgH family protein [Proteobacteria bacterium]|nr:YqgE/AlgH family protein [Pseudomonadota bacterium]